MMIDFHTHIFPSSMASSVLKVLKEGIRKYSGFLPTAYTDATADGLRVSMAEAGIGLSVVLPIATKPTQTATINRYAKEVSGNGILSFGTLHPGNEDTEGILEELAENGFVGIKLHPEFQKCRIDSPESLRILRKAEELGLYTVVHAGNDLGMPKPLHCTPEMLNHVLGEVSGRYLIAAHMGGLDLFDDVEKYLVGKPLYFDTAFVNGRLDAEQARRMITAHGADKILFGSDSPWGDQKAAVSYIRSLGLPEADEAAILGENAARILRLTGLSHETLPDKM